MTTSPRAQSFVDRSVESLRKQLEHVNRTRQALDEKAQELEADLAALTRVISRNLLDPNSTRDESTDAGDITLTGATRADALRTVIKESIAALGDEFSSTDVLRVIETNRPDLLTDRAYATRLFKEYVQLKGFTEVKPSRGPNPAVFSKGSLDF